MIKKHSALTIPQLRNDHFLSFLKCVELQFVDSSQKNLKGSFTYAVMHSDDLDGYD